MNCDCDLHSTSTYITFLFKCYTYINAAQMGGKLQSLVAESHQLLYVFCCNRLSQVPFKKLLRTHSFIWSVTIPCPMLILHPSRSSTLLYISKILLTSIWLFDLYTVIFWAVIDYVFDYEDLQLYKSDFSSQLKIEVTQHNPSQLLASSSWIR